MAPQSARGIDVNTAASLFNQGLLAEALRVCERLIAASPRNFDALQIAALVQARQGRHGEAIKHFDAALRIRPHSHDAHLNKAVSLMELRRFDAALAGVEAALRIVQGARALWLKGRILQHLRRHGDAVACFEAASQLAPGDDGVLSDWGLAMLEMDRVDASQACLEKALALNPRNALARHNLGLAWAHRADHLRALAHFDEALQVRRAYPDALCNRGIALANLQRFDEALASFDEALAAQPDHAAALAHRGAVLLRFRRPDEARASAARALERDPGLTDAHHTLGGALVELDRFEEALASFGKVIEAQPRLADGHNKRAVALMGLRRFDEAAAAFDEAAALAPDPALIHFNKSMLLLLTGRLREGWALYESRLRGGKPIAYAAPPGPAWTGEEDLRGKTLWVGAEQGLGDMIQVSRYLPLLWERGAHPVFEVPKPLLALMASLGGDVHLVQKGAPRPAFDHHCPAMSLPLAFRTELETIPAAVPYLHADAGKAQAWRERLGTPRGLRVGFAWSGWKGNPGDFKRSIPLGLLAPLLALPIEAHSLQTDYREGDADLMQQLGIADHRQHLADFSETAALVDTLDLVISVDTSVAHLAGAMAKPVWILLPFLPDYRWLLERPDSPWYPTASLFRQPSAGGWAQVIDTVKTALAART
ncbi:MAG: tetratricopeptide repeat protein [Pseudomonadota bacterium]